MSIVGRRRGAEEMRLAEADRQKGEAEVGAMQEAAGSAQAAQAPLHPVEQTPRQAEQFKVIRRLRRGRWTLTEVPA